MNKSNLVWFGRYEGWLRMLAHGVKDYDDECIRKAAKLFDLMLPDGCVVVPMPSHEGVSMQMLAVANHMPGNRRVVDMLRCVSHESCYTQKKDGFAPAPFDMWCKPWMLLEKDVEVYVIDNVICTGTTAGAAIRAFSAMDVKARVCALAYSPWR